MPLAAHPPGPPPRSGPADLAAARAHILAARPGDAPHEAHRANMLAFVAAHPDALDRTCADGHLTGSAMVVDPESRRFLLMLHAKLGRWFQPGGHADGDGDLPTVAWKEATEETGIAGLSLVTPAVDLDIHEVDPPHGPHLHLDVRYLALAPRGAEPGPQPRGPRPPLGDLRRAAGLRRRRRPAPPGPRRPDISERGQLIAHRTPRLDAVDLLHGGVRAQHRHDRRRRPGGQRLGTEQRQDGRHQLGARLSRVTDR